MPTALLGIYTALFSVHTSIHKVIGMPKMAALIKAITNARLTKVPLAMQASEDVSQKPWSFVGVVERRPHFAYVHS